MYFCRMQITKNKFLLNCFVLIFISLGSLAFCFKFHPFYLSVTEIHYNESTKKIEISAKLFIDDFEKTLAQTYKVPIDLIHPKDEIFLQNKIESYIQSRLSISCDKQILNLIYLGSEIEEDVIWCYFESKEINKPKLISVSNSLLYQFIESQINILHLTIGKSKKSYKLENPNSTVDFIF